MRKRKPPELLGPGEVARLLGVTDSRVRAFRLWGSPWGALPSLKVGGRHVFERGAVDDFVRRRVAHFDQLAAEGRTLPPRVKRPKLPES